MERRLLRLLVRAGDRAWSVVKRIENLSVVKRVSCGRILAEV